MDSKQRATLRSQANTLETIIQIGKNGVTDESVKVINQAFSNKELIKIKVMENSPISAMETAQCLAEKTKSEVVQVIGTRFVLYRKLNKPKKVLKKNPMKNINKSNNREKREIPGKIIRRGINRGKKKIVPGNE